MAPMTELAMSWLNVDFVEKVLRKSEGDDTIHVIDIFHKPATNKGDNYTSDLFRVSVELTRNQAGKPITEKRSIIVKVAPVEEGMRKQLIQQSGIFLTEMTMMMSTLKKMNKLLGPNRALSARGLYVQKENPMLLVLEDLAVHGYRMANRLSGLDFDHSRIAIQSLARFHASSVAVCEKELKERNFYGKNLFSDEQPSDLFVFFEQGIKALAEEVRNWEGYGVIYADKIKKFGDIVRQKGQMAFKVREDEFNVINHGDVWVNNMLFRYDDSGKPVGHVFVDFQLCNYTSPAIDLLYFLSTSLNSEVYDECRGQLLEEYQRTLTATMMELDCVAVPPTLAELRKYMRERMVYGMIASFTVLPIVMADARDVKDINEILSNDGTYENLTIKSLAYRRILQKRLPMYDELGLFD